MISTQHLLPSALPTPLDILPVVNGTAQADVASESAEKTPGACHHRSLCLIMVLLTANDLLMNSSNCRLFSSRGH